MTRQHEYTDQASILTNPPTVESCNLSANDLLHQYYEDSSRLCSTNEGDFTTSANGLFSPLDLHYDTHPQIGNRLEPEYLSGFFLDSDPVGFERLASTSSSPDEGYLRGLTTERRRRSSTRSDSSASTQSLLGHRLGDAASAAKEPIFDGTVADISTRAAPDAYGRNKARGAEPIPSDRTLLRLMASLPEGSKTWLNRKIREDFPEATSVSVKEEVAFLKDSGRFSSRLDSRKRTFVAGIVAYLMQDETTRLIWQRDIELLEKLAPILLEQLNHIGQTAGVEANDFAQAACVFLWMLGILN
ncbi:hypothetical protein Trco_006997 [Trichoderma cornu-damae]|uniref:Uncharacterized protein n=1 Tax=Trichoderma cornu-damae TaxID=654480 RepID=A0A9P8QHH6_9HYPO|nr:hypothetical protein Trco_006997 [Trichoderma cornu-damae]